MLKLFLLVSLFSQFSWGQSEARFTLEPLFGIETKLVRYPEPSRMVTRQFFGARAVYGVTLLSGELEFTRSQSQQNYPSRDLKVSDQLDRLNLGVRSTLPVSSFFAFYLRLGGSASQGKTTLTQTGVKREEDNPLTLNPYAGAGIQVAVSSFLAINAGATLIRNREDKYDTQYSLGLSARFGTLR